MSIITINDIFAYMCGFFLGSTPLIVLSPKKTVEGFIGGKSELIETLRFCHNYSIVKLSLSIFQSLNLSLSLRDRDRADTIITLPHHPPSTENFLSTLEVIHHWNRQLKPK